MQLKREELDFRIRPPGFKAIDVRLDNVRSSRPTPDLARIAARRARTADGPVEEGGSGGPEPDSVPIAGGPRAVLTTVTDMSTQQTAANPQKRMRDAQERRWSAARPTLVDGYKRRMSGYQAQRRDFVESEGNVYRAMLQKLIDAQVCETCTHHKITVWREVTVDIVTFTGVHQIQIPVWGCER